MLRKRTILIASILFSLYSISCIGEKNSYKNDNIIFNNGKIKIITSDLKVTNKKNNNETNITLVTARLYVENITSNDFIFNLENVYLNSESGVTSNEIYIDSVASLLIQDIILRGRQKVQYDVYWVFDNNINTSELNNFFIAYN